MIDVRILQSAEPTTDQLEKLRQYASVPNNLRDALLNQCLKTAMLAVQEYTNTAMLACTLRLSVTDVKRGEEFKLYQGGKTIISVEDQDGNTPSYIQTGDRIVVNQDCRGLIVTYQNEVLLPELSKHETTAWQYATALYDGEEPAMLASVLKQTYFGC